MALASIGWELQVTLRGSDGKETLKTWQTSAAVDTDAKMVTAVAAFLPLLAAVSDCVISRYNVVRKFEDAAATYPAGNVLVSDRAQITVELSDSPSKSGTITIPGPKSDIFMGAIGPERRQVNLAAEELVAYLQVFGAAGNFTLSDGEYYSAIKKGRRISAKDNGSSD